MLRVELQVIILTVLFYAVEIHVVVVDKAVLGSELDGTEWGGDFFVYLVAQ